MLRVLCPAAAPRALRRLVAALLCVLLGGTSAEPFLADVCDGDAPRAALRTVLPHVDAGAVVGTVSADSSAPAAVADVPGVAMGAPADPAQRQQEPQHAVHVCHCTHAHGGALAEAPRVRTHALSRVATPTLAARSDRLPPSPTREPQFRPPALPDAV